MSERMVKVTVYLMTEIEDDTSVELKLERLINGHSSFCAVADDFDVPPGAESAVECEDAS